MGLRMLGGMICECRELRGWTREYGEVGMEMWAEGQECVEEGDKVLGWGTHEFGEAGEHLY